MDLASLKLKIDASEVEQATKALDELAAAAERANEALSKLGGPITVTVGVDMDDGGQFAAHIKDTEDSIASGARRSDHHFKL